MALGGATKRTFGLPATGRTSIGPSILPAPRLISCSWKRETWERAGRELPLVHQSSKELAVSGVRLSLRSGNRCGLGV